MRRIFLNYNLVNIKLISGDCEVPLHLHNYLNEEPIYVRFLDGLIIIIAFSVHSLFDGISIGIKTTTSEIWTMFIAIASHKLLISFIISVELYEKCANIILVAFHMVLFSIMSPIGILIVIIAEESISSESESNPIVVLLSAISSGTILYIVFFEILQKERVSRLSGIIQLVSMAIGFGIMFCVITTLRE
jgi:zinc transporter 1/2/3